MEDRILLAGCGYVGTRLALELRDEGAEVYGLRRRVEALPEGIVRVPADLSAPGALPEVPELDLLVYSPSAGERTDEAYKRAYVDGVERLADALGERASRLRRAIFVSSTAVYGELEGEVDEKTIPKPTAQTAIRVLEGEEAFLARFPNALVLRLAGIYGPTRGRVVRQILAGGPFDAPADTYGNRIHRDDCAGALAHLLRHPAPSKLYVGVDDAPVSHAEVRRFIANLLGKDESPFVEPAHTRGKRLSNVALKASGYQLRVPTYREGYRALVDEVVPQR